MWVAITPGSGTELQAVESPRLVVDACPHCNRRARLVEKVVTRRNDGAVLPWKKREVVGRVLQCQKCSACFELTGEGLPAWNEKPAERERNLKLADLRARWRIAQAEIARWRKRAELALRSGQTPLAEEARRLAARYEGESLALRTEIERLGGELPKPPQPDPAEAKLDEELAALREKNAARKAAASARTDEPVGATPAELDAPDAPAEAADDEQPAPTGDAVDDELAALKRRVGRKDPPAEAPPPSGAAPDGDDELAALKRRLKNKN